MTPSADRRLPVLVLAGPTAAGKSALALALAQALNGTIINADSAQIVREVAILSARPTAEDMAGVPHRLYGVQPAAIRGSVTRWHQACRACIARTQDEGRLPIVVGGTGLYLRALFEGPPSAPSVPEAVRAAVNERLSVEGPQALHRWLEQHDPDTAARLAPADRTRIVRAVEVLEATGRPLSAWLDRSSRPQTTMRGHVLVLLPPRDRVYAACDARFVRMVGAGAVEEVRTLLQLRLDPDLPAMKIIGVPELSACLRGEHALESAISLAQTATRNYAKRQYTWFRHQIRPSATLSVRPLETAPAAGSDAIRALIDETASALFHATT